MLVKAQVCGNDYANVRLQPLPPHWSFIDERVAGGGHVSRLAHREKAVGSFVDAVNKLAAEVSCVEREMESGKE